MGRVLWWKNMRVPGWLLRAKTVSYCTGLHVRREDLTGWREESSGSDDEKPSQWAASFAAHRGSSAGLPAGLPRVPEGGSVIPKASLDMEQLAARTRAEPLDPRPDLAAPDLDVPLASELEDNEAQEGSPGTEGGGDMRRMKGSDRGGGGSETPPLREEGLSTGAMGRSGSTDSSGEGSEGSSAESSMLDVTTQGGTSLCDAAAPASHQARRLHTAPSLACMSLHPCSLWCMLR